MAKAKRKKWECRCACHESGKEIAHSTPCCSTCPRCGKKVRLGEAFQSEHLKRCLTIPPPKMLQKIAASSIFPKAAVEDAAAEESEAYPDYSSESGIIDVAALPGDLFYKPRE